MKMFIDRGSCLDLQEIRSSSNLSMDRVTALLKTNSNQADFNTLAAGTDSVMFSVFSYSIL